MIFLRTIWFLYGLSMTLLTVSTISRLIFSSSKRRFKDLWEDAFFIFLHPLMVFSKEGRSKFSTMIKNFV
jgi:hypothetical protein